MNINGGKSKSSGVDKDNERSKAAKNILMKLKSENARLSDLVVKTEVIFEFRMHNWVCNKQKNDYTIIAEIIIGFG